MYEIAWGNTVWWIVLGYHVAVAAVAFLWLRTKPKEKVKKYLIAACWTLLGLYFVQRFCILRSERYLSIYGDGWDNIIASLLPLQPCYISLFFTLIGLKKENKYLLSFCFYLSTLGVIFSVLAPDPCYIDISIFEPSVFLSYLMHGIMLVVYTSIGLQGFVEIGLKTAFASLVTLVVLGSVMHVINMVGISCGLTMMNYFFTASAQGIGLLELFWSCIPVPYLYMLIPCLPIAFVWCALVVLLFQKVIPVRTA